MGLHAWLLLATASGAFAATGLRSRSDQVAVLTFDARSNWGDWRAFDYCPESMWAVGAQLRVEDDQGTSKDDTALNSVRLLCAPLGVFGTTYQFAESYGGIWGSWKPEHFCKESLVTGFDLRSEGFQGEGDSEGKDDTAANNLKMMCSNRAVTELDGLWYGDWTGMKICPTGSAPCGLQIQFEGDQGSDDDTAMNNMKVACCQVHMNATCENPKEMWSPVMSCDNLKSDSPSECTYDKTVGLTSTKGTTTSVTDRTTLSVKVMAEVGANFELISAKLATTLGLSQTTGYDWTNTQSESYQKATTTTVKIVVPPHTRKSVEQVVGECGDASVRANSFRFVDG